MSDEEGEILQGIAEIITAKSMLLFSDASDLPSMEVIVQGYEKGGEPWLSKVRFAILMRHVEFLVEEGTRKPKKRRMDGTSTSLLAPFTGFADINPNYRNLFSNFADD